ncbi:hypothetical protein ABT369_03855 [Dactylosporangium sp. NPDC000244]|uniref:hypothetical protein n=1 Tax=Dactylosporangium sp. NPDC000244 TaxID=3154365 RepID=UPI0033300B92
MESARGSPLRRRGNPERDDPRPNADTTRGRTAQQRDTPKPDGLKRDDLMPNAGNACGRTARSLGTPERDASERSGNSMSKGRRSGTPERNGDERNRDRSGEGNDRRVREGDTRAVDAPDHDEGKRDAATAGRACEVPDRHRRDHDERERDASRAGSGCDERNGTRAG